jgi:hypothetical protein
MALTKALSPSTWTTVGTRLTVALSIGLVMAGSGSAAEPSVTVEYRSAFVDYRHFDSQTPTAEWRAANDAVRDGTEAAGHGHGTHNVPSTKTADRTLDTSAGQAGTPSSHDPAAPPKGHEPTVTESGDLPGRRE